MSNESTKAAFEKAFSDHMLLNLEDEAHGEIWLNYPGAAAVRAHVDLAPKGVMTCLISRRSQK